MSKKTPEALKEMEGMLEEGVSMPDIASHFRISERTARRWKQEIDWIPPEPTHGTWAKVRTGCSCKPCRKLANGASVKSVERRHLKSLKNATRDREPWTEEDEKVLLEHGPAKAAEILKRTYYSTRNRREIIRRREVSV